MAKKEAVQIEEKEEQTLEEMFESLDEVIMTMEKMDISLEESFRLYHTGMDMLKSCSDRLDKIEKKMLMLDSEGKVHDFE